MKVTLYMATSIDGFIAKMDGNSDWVSPVDTVNFEAKINEKGCIVLGHRTLEQYRGELYPVKGITNIVLTKNPTKEGEIEDAIFVVSPTDALKVAKEKGYSEVLLIGGGRTNGSFLKEDLIDEIFLSVHPIILGEGIKLFENCEARLDLELLEEKKLEEGLFQLYYKVRK